MEIKEIFLANFNLKHDLGVNFIAC